MKSSFRKIIVVLMFGMIMMPSMALAYMGPGAGISAIGSIIAIIAVVLVAIFGFLWYPLKRLFRNNKNKEKVDETE